MSSLFLFSLDCRKFFFYNYLMKLKLKNHNYKYGVEQMLSTLFPGEKPDYSGFSKDERGMSISLSKKEKFTTAVCVYNDGESRHSGRAAVKTALLTDETSTDSLCQYVIKNAIYRSVLASGRAKPPWGSLTGVRPGKLMHGIIGSSSSKSEAIRRFENDYDVSKSRAALCYETSLCTVRARQSLKPYDACLYIGIPFCPTRCAYCSFVSQSVEKSIKLIEPFLSALREEIAAVSEQIKKANLNIVSVYFGGGTPTTLSASQLNSLLSYLYSEIDLSSVREFTVEAGRPDTITEDKLEVLKHWGVNRVSVNPQTMQDNVLNAIGRKHTAKDITDALALVRKTGGFAVNMDIIAGLPEDSVEGFSDTLKKVLALNPENITVHTLSLKRGSAITLSNALIPTAAEVSQMLDAAYSALRESGYLPYYLYRQKNMSGGFENTGWTLPGHENLYNICMMEEICSIIGLGGGGSTKLISPEGGRNIRITDPKYPLEYIELINKICSDKTKIGEFCNV